MRTPLPPGSNRQRIPCPHELVPGRMLGLRIAGRKLLLANVDGRFYATDDTCTHEDASLSCGSLHGELVKCPLHGSRFDLRTGAALEEPAVKRLQTYPVQYDAGTLIIDLSPGDPE